MDPLILFIVGAVGLVGCVILLLLGLNMLREERGSKDDAAAQTAAPNSAASAPAAPSPDASKPSGASGASAVGAAFAGVTARFSGGAARGNAHEVLRVLRDNLTGRIALEIGGKRYANLDEVAEGEVRQGLLTTLQDLEAFAGGVARLPAVERAASPPAASLARQALASRSASLAAPAAPSEYRPLPAPSMNPFKQIAVLREMAKNPPPAPKSIAEQIDDVLQEQIIGTPLIHRGLHVRPGPRGDAIFEADGQSYSSADDLPDVEVRDAIRAAIADWESKQ